MSCFPLRYQLHAKTQNSSACNNNDIAVLVRITSKRISTHTRQKKRTLKQFKAALGRQVGALVVATCAISELKANIALLEADAVGLNERLKEGSKRKDDPSRLGGIDDSFIFGKKEEAVRSLRDLSSHAVF